MIGLQLKRLICIRFWICIPVHLLASFFFKRSIYSVKYFFSREITGHPEGNVYAVAFTPCDSYLVTGSGLGDLRVWDITNMQVCVIDYNEILLACQRHGPRIRNIKSDIALKPAIQKYA